MLVGAWRHVGGVVNWMVVDDIMHGRKNERTLLENSVVSIQMYAGIPENPVLWVLMWSALGVDSPVK